MADQWRHAEEVSTGDEVCCAVDSGPTGRWPNVCGCDTPDPDPASPCGHKFEDGATCGRTADQFPHDWPSHAPHIPTRCTCGHAIAAARKEEPR